MSVEVFSCQVKNIPSAVLLHHCFCYLSEKFTCKGLFVIFILDYKTNQISILIEMGKGKVEAISASIKSETISFVFPGVAAMVIRAIPNVIGIMDLLILRLVVYRLISFPE